MSLGNKNNCPHCHSSNWSSNEYCNHCSGELYENSIKKNDRTTVLLTKLPMGL